MSKEGKSKKPLDFTRGKEKEKIKELEELLKRVQADFMNYKKRAEEERINLLKSASKETIIKIIPVLDNLDRALKHSPKDLKGNEWISGLNHIKNQFENILKGEGLEIIETKGKEFDHNLHEAISFVEGKGREDEIIEEYEKGYLLNGQVIRPAKVVVRKISNF